MAPKPKRRQWTPAKDTLVVNGVAVEWSLSKDGMVQYGAKVDGKRPTFTLRKVETEADAPRRVREALKPRDADNGVDAADGSVPEDDEPPGRKEDKEILNAAISRASTWRCGMGGRSD